MDVFENYIKQFDLKNAKIIRKYRHSLRVVHLCEILANELKLEKSNIELIKICGLFHDIARFKQTQIYDSFKDTKTFDHGDEGEKIFLNEIAPLLDLSEDEIILIGKAIRYHNKFSIGSDVNENEKLFCKILRDADKIDILYQISSIPGLLHPNDGEISSENDTDFMKKRSLNYKNVHTSAEENLLLLAFIWDINYDNSLKIIKDNKYYERIEKILNDNKYAKYFELIFQYLKSEVKNDVK